MAEQKKDPSRDIERERTGRQPGRQESGQRGATEQGRKGGTSDPSRQGQKEREEMK